MGKKYNKMGGFSTLVRESDQDLNAIPSEKTYEPQVIQIEEQASSVLNANAEPLSIKLANKKKSNKPAYTKTCVLIIEENFLTLKSLAYWDRKNLQDIVNEALQDYINKNDDSKITSAIEAYKASIQ